MTLDEILKRHEVKLTRWEAGNELVYANDQLCKVSAELKDWPELKGVIDQARKLIVDKFNAESLVDEMGFGI